MHTKALSVMGPEGGSKAAPVVVTHPTAGDRRSIARVQIPPLPLVSCVRSASGEYLYVFRPYRVVILVKLDEVSGLA